MARALVIIVGIAGVLTVGLRLARADEFLRADPERADELARSVHRSLACSACHREHGTPRAECARCHAAETTQLATGRHRELAMSCVDCHGSHAVLSTTSPGSRTAPAAIGALCGGCHEDAARASYGDAHAIAVASAKPSAPTCSACHRAHDVVRAVSPITCARCHSTAVTDHARGAHAATVACATCHRPHGEPQGLASGGARTIAGSVARCASCHPRAADDHERGPHGAAARLGDPRAPACVTCHAAHAVLPDRDPSAAISEARRGELCGTCHRGAGPRFAAGAFHHDPSTLGHRVTGWVRSMYIMMIVVVIGGMLVHNGIDLRRRWLDRRRRKHAETARSGGTIARFTRFERVQHWTLASSFITLLVTGFSFRLGWRPSGLDPATWAAWRAGVHRGAAIVFVALAIVHVVWLITSHRGRTNLKALRPRIRSAKDVLCVAACCLRLGPPSTADWRALLDTMKYGLGRAPSRPAQGRFTYAEKMEYYALVWGGFVMVATGVVLWFVVPVLDRAPAWIAHLAGVVHLFEATLAGLAIVVWHFYFVMVRPEVFPISKAMITGRIPTEEQDEEHALERHERCSRCGHTKGDCTCRTTSSDAPSESSS